MPGLRKRNSNRPSPAPHIKHRLTRLERQQLHKIPGIRGSLKRPKMPSPFVPLKRVISPMPSSLQAHPFIIPIHRKQLRTNFPISHGPSSSQQKNGPSQKEEPQPAYIRKNRSNANPPHQPSGAGAKRLQPGQNPTEVPLCGSPAARRQAYKVDREFRTSRRALNVLSVRVRTVRAGDLICLPPGSGAPRPNPSASSSASSAAPGSVHHGGRARCRRWGSPA